MGRPTITLDSRRRVSLAKHGNREHVHYLVEDFPDGTIILTPAVVIPASEVRKGTQ